MIDSILMTANGGFGDVACSTCLLHHRETLWPGKRLIWLIHPDCKDVLQFNDKIDEVRVGDIKNGLFIDPETTLTLNTAPWSNQLMAAQGVPYALIPMRVVGQDFKEWHPYIGFSKEEDDAAGAFVQSLPYPKTVMLETTCRSGQSSWGSANSAEAMRICRNVMGPCNFLFASKSGFAGTSKQSLGLEGEGVFELGSFTMRQCLPIYNRCHLMIGIASGLSCVFCSWQASPLVERVEFVYNRQFGTWPMARGPLATATDVPTVYKEIEAAAVRIKTSCG